MARPYATKRWRYGVGAEALTLLVSDTFTAADGTLITSRACDTGQTPVVFSGYSAATSTIQSNQGQFAGGGVYYTASSAVRRITADYINVGANGGNNDLRFCSNNGGDTDGYLLRLKTDLTMIDLSVGGLAWDEGASPSGLTSGTATVDITATKITVTIVDGSIGTFVRNYTAAISNSTSTRAGPGGNPGVPAFDNFKIYG